MALGITVALGVVTLKIQRQQTEIARQQASTNRLQYRLSLFERRMKIFDAATKLFGEIGRDARVELPQLFQFLRETREAGGETAARIIGRNFCSARKLRNMRLDEVCLIAGGFVNKGNNARVCQCNKKGLELRTRDTVRRPEDITIETELLIWFSNQFQVATHNFLPYLDFREP